MASSHSITSFPADINRDHFASWLSGFTDGEGCFRLTRDTRQNSQCTSPGSSFQIGLRSDDLRILEIIQLFFGCGRIFNEPRAYNGGSPKSLYRVQRIDELVEVIIPHFEKFPLLAKKARDFVIWKEGVLLHQEVSKRPRITQWGGGRISRWKPEELERFTELLTDLKKQREYQAPAIIPKPDKRSKETFFGNPLE